MSNQPERTLAVPEEVLIAVAPRVRDLTELKLVLTVARLAAQTSSDAVPFDTLLDPANARSIVEEGSAEPAEQRVYRAVTRAVANGSLLRADVRSDEGLHSYLMSATERGRRLLEQLATGQLGPDDQPPVPAQAHTIIYRPNGFALYERHIGPLTPLIAEQLRDAERLYPRAWIEEAILTAVQYNKRNWRYISAVLARWEESGESHGVARQRT
ncbi:MAG TPA: DnaD domain protein [Chloroflexota bacterium]